MPNTKTYTMFYIFNLARKSLHFSMLLCLFISFYSINTFAQSPINCGYDATMSYKPPTDITQQAADDRDACKTVRVFYIVPTNALHNNRQNIVYNAVLENQQKWSQWGATFTVEPIETIYSTHDINWFINHNDGFHNNTDFNWLGNSAIEVISNSDISLYDPNHRVVFFLEADVPCPCSAAANFGFAGQPKEVIDGIANDIDPYIGVIGHELGHTFGMPHENCDGQCAPRGVMCNNYGIDNCGNPTSYPNLQLTPWHFNYLNQPEFAGYFEENGCNSYIQFKSKVALQGALLNTVNNNMRVDLKENNLIPTYDPYYYLPEFITVGSTGPAAYNANLFPNSGLDQVVDWIFLELRAQSNPSQVLATQSVLLQADGDLVMTDGTSPIRFDLPEGNYYIAVRHRNHLGAMTAYPLYLGQNTSNMIDFTSPALSTWGSNARVNINGYMALWAGTTNGGSNNIIFQGIGNDINDIFFDVLNYPSNYGQQANFIAQQYESSDINMDSHTVYQGFQNDVNLIFFNTLTHPGNTTQVSNYIIYEQLP